MAKKEKITDNQKKLIRRYLIWCYKTTKESLDRIDRYDTQFMVDMYVREQLKKIKVPKADEEYQKFITSFEQYMNNKILNAHRQKYMDENQKALQPQYRYLQNRLMGIEKAIQKFLGSKELKGIQEAYEVEMTRRIWEAREHN